MMKLCINGKKTVSEPTPEDVCDALSSLRDEHFLILERGSEEFLQVRAEEKSRGFLEKLRYEHFEEDIFGRNPPAELDYDVEYREQGRQYEAQLRAADRAAVEQVFLAYLAHREDWKDTLEWNEITKSKGGTRL